jgi:hypothetical protein
VQAYGTDRVAVAADGSWTISSRRSKGWTARVPRTLTTAEFPGTAVLWDDQYFEVVSATPLPDDAVRYVLAPWADQHAIRVSDRYDAGSEEKRDAEHRKMLQREKGRKTANFLGMFTGLLPAVVQEQLASELGLLATRLTLLSLIPPMLFVTFVLDAFVRSTLNRTAPPSFVLLLIAMYLGVETATRLHVVWGQGRPIGSVVGLIVYSIAWLFGVRRAGAVSPIAASPGTSVRTTPAPPDIALRDMLAMRAPFMTLLSPDEQRRLEARYAFDYRAHARTVAVIILIASVGGVISSAVKLSNGIDRISVVASLLVAALLAIEQVSRLRTLRHGPAGSFLAFLVRPFVRKLL